MQFLTPKEKAAILEFKSRLKTVLKGNLVKLELFGSKASGAFDRDSDLDVFVLVSKLSLDLINKIAEISLQIDLKYDVLLSPLVYDEYEFEQNKRLGSPIVGELDTKGVLL